MRRSFVILVASLIQSCNGCSGLDDPPPICDPPFISLAEPTALEYGPDGKVYVAATWYFRDDPCELGSIGAAVYRIDPVDGSIETQVLGTGTGEGFLAGGEFRFLAQGRVTLFTVSAGTPMMVVGTSLSGIADDVATFDDRGFIAMSDADEVLVVGTAGWSSLADEGAAGLAILDGSLWSNGTMLSKFDLISLAETAAYPVPCVSQGPLAAIGDSVVVQCSAGGAIAVSSTGAAINTIEGERFVRLDGREGFGTGFASFNESNETQMLVATGGLLTPVIVGVLEDRVEFADTDTALIVVSGLAARIEIPSGAGQALVSSEFAQLAVRPGQIAVATGVLGVYELTLYLLDPVTFAVIDEYPLPPPDVPFFEEE